MKISNSIKSKFKSSSAKARNSALQNEDRMALYILNLTIKGKGILRENRKVPLKLFYACT